MQGPSCTAGRYNLIARGTRCLYVKREGLKRWEDGDKFPFRGWMMAFGHIYSLLPIPLGNPFLPFSDTRWFLDATSFSCINSPPSLYWLASVSIINGHPCLDGPNIGGFTNDFSVFLKEIALYCVCFVESAFQSWRSTELSEREM